MQNVILLYDLVTRYMVDNIQSIFQASRNVRIDESPPFYCTLDKWSVKCYTVKSGKRREPLIRQIRAIQNMNNVSL